MIINKGLHRVIGRISENRKRNIHRHFFISDCKKWLCTLVVPLFWYAMMTLGVPLANAAYRVNPARFAEHCLVVVSGCLIVGVAVSSVKLGWQCLKSRIRLNI
jgi:hypothetical protein